MTIHENRGKIIVANPFLFSKGEKTMQKKIVSLLLVACMLLAMLPALALNMFAAGETYKTSFGENSDYYPTWKLTEEPPVTGTVGVATVDGSWNVGSLAVTATKINATDFAPVTFGTAFTPFVYLETSGCSAIVNAHTSTWESNSAAMGGGFGVNYDGAHPNYKNMMMMGIKFDKIDATPETPGHNDGNKSNVTGIFATVAVRYVAEYSGTIDITFDVGYAQPNGTYLTVLQNGEVIGTFEYGTKTGTIEDVTVNMGDVIDFASTPDLNYDYDSYAAAGYTQAFDYNKPKRGLIVREFAVEFAAGYYTPDVGVGEANAEFTTTLSSTNVNDPARSFYAWYKADGTRVVTGTPAAGYYAIVNPYLIENGIISEDDTYQVAMEKYRAFLKDSFKVVYTGNWSIGQMNGTSYDEYRYPSLLDQKNPYMIRTASSGAQSITGFAYSRLVSETQFDKMFDSWYASGWKGTTTNNTTIPSATTKVADIKVSYSADLSTPKDTASTQGDLCAWAPTSLGAAGGIEQMWWNETTGAITAAKAFYTRPGSTSTNVSSMQAGAIVYTAPATGVVTFDAYSVKFHSSAVNSGATTENLDTKVAVFINGVQKTAWATIDNKNGNNPADQLDALIATMGTIVVYAGDEVQFVCVRGASGGTHVNMSIEAFLDTSKLPVVYKSGDTVLAQFIGKKGDALPVLEGYDNFGSSGYMVNGVYTTELPATVEEGLLIEDFFINTSASIAISGDFLLNVYVDGAETATTAGIIVNGVVFPGVKQANGKYKVELAAINAGDLLDAEYTYYAYQYHNDGSYRLSKKATTVNTGKLLDTYVDGETDVATKNMADAIRDYAYMAKLYFTNGTLEDNASIKNELKGPFTILNGQNGSNHTNYDSGLYDVMLATLKKYSVEGYVPAYTNTNYKDPVTGQLDTFVDAPNVFPANKVEWGFGDQNPTDAAFKYAINGVTLNLAENVGFAIKIAANGANDIAALADGFQVKVTVGNGVVHYYDAFVYVDETKSEVAVVVDGVPAGFFDQDYTFTVVDADGNAVSATYTYSVLAWIVNEYQFGSSSVKVYLVRALYRMGLMAEEYIHG